MGRGAAEEGADKQRNEPPALTDASLPPQPLQLDGRVQRHAHHLLRLPGKATSQALPLLIWSGDISLDIQPKPVSLV